MRRSFVLAALLGWLYYLARVLVVRRPGAVVMLIAAVAAFLLSGYLLAVTERGSWSVTSATDAEGPPAQFGPTLVGDAFSRGLSHEISQQAGETVTVRCPLVTLGRGEQIQCPATLERDGSVLLYVVTRLADETITWFQVAP